MEEAAKFYVLFVGAPKKDFNMEAAYLMSRNYRLKKRREEKRCFRAASFKNKSGR